MVKKGLPGKKLKISVLTLVTAILLAAIFLFLPGQNIYQVSFAERNPLVAGVNITLPSPAPYPVNFTNVTPPDLTARAILIMDIPSGVWLYQKNPQARLSPASTTKVMTALVALDYFKMDDILTIKTPITEGRVMGLVPGEKLTFENLLYGALVHSGNDAAYAIADNYPGGVSAFVEKMNEKARELSLSGTRFDNPIGFEGNDHFTTAEDLARLANVALKNPTIARIVGTPAITVADAGFSRFYQLENVNQLLGKIPGVLGIKTGWTENAGECLVTAITRDNKKILIVVLDSKDRFGETTALIDWTFNNFQWQVIAPPTPD